MNINYEELQEHWDVIGPLLTLRDEQDYDRAVEHINSLLDLVGSDERHPLYELLDTLGTLVHAYEEQHYPMSASSGAQE
jgi:HTH-type transcriptional regulator / antitoxin HigA